MGSARLSNMATGPLLPLLLVAMVASLLASPLPPQRRGTPLLARLGQRLVRGQRIPRVALGQGPGLPRVGETTQPPPARSDAVPIAVGGALAGLILVVLITYFGVRARRSRSQN